MNCDSWPVLPTKVTWSQNKFAASMSAQGHHICILSLTGASLGWEHSAEEAQQSKNHSLLYQHLHVVDVIS